MKIRQPFSRRVLTLLGGSIALLLGTVLSAELSHAAERTVISSGHIDLGPRFVDGQWTFQVRDDAANPPAWRNLSELVLGVPDEAKITVPSGAAYSFLGKSGDSIYVLPQVQKAGVIWPG
jgi:hypothetical protein